MKMCQSKSEKQRTLHEVSVQKRRAPLGAHEERPESEDDDFLDLFV
jgi:hypothetical protein